MKSILFMQRLMIICLFLLVLVLQGSAQKVIALDNWYNNEINKKTGKVYHYTWSDEAQSGFSQLGEIFENRGAELKTITSKLSGKILKEAAVYIIVDPDTTTENPNPNYIEPKDVRTIKRWVSKGGVLLLMANDGSNCEFTHFNLLARTFGFYFEPVTLNKVVKHQYEMAAETNLPKHKLFEGVRKIYMKEVSSIVIFGEKMKPVLVDDNNNILIAETDYGKGYVFAIGDPWLYNEYIDHLKLPESFDNLKAANNLIDLLLEHTQK
jgi:unsaturated rhamnogalacturonyl hydrolase